MKAVAVFPATRKVQLIDCEEPHIRHPHEAKVQMLEVGICGTDKEICRFEYGTPPQGADYLIIGHESLGEVTEVGAAVEDLHIGDLVVVMVRRPCPHAWCRACCSGRPDFCTTHDFTECGIKERHGFMAEFFVDDARNMVVVPPALRDVAVLVEPTTIAIKALLQAAIIQQRLPWFDAHRPADQMEQGYKGLVLGAGAVGLLGAMALRDVGFETYIYDRSPAPNAKSQLVESIGARYVSPSDTTEQFTHLIEGVDFIYEATGASRLAFRAIQALGPNSIFVFTGIPALQAPSDVDTDLIMRKMVMNNQVILGTVNAGKDAFTAAIRAIETFTQRWPTAVHTLISSRQPLEAYHEVLLHKGGIKNVLALG